MGVLKHVLLVCVLKPVLKHDNLVFSTTFLEHFRVDRRKLSFRTKYLSIEIFW